MAGGKELQQAIRRAWRHRLRARSRLEASACRQKGSITATQRVAICRIRWGSQSGWLCHAGGGGGIGCGVDRPVEPWGMLRLAGYVSIHFYGSHPSADHPQQGANVASAIRGERRLVPLNCLRQPGDIASFCAKMPADEPLLPSGRYRPAIHALPSRCRSEPIAVLTVILDLSTFSCL